MKLLRRVLLLLRTEGAALLGPQRPYREAEAAIAAWAERRRAFAKEFENLLKGRDA